VVGDQVADGLELLAGGEQVRAGEKQMLDQVRAALGAA